MNNTITAVLVGCGNISQVWLDAVRNISNIKIVGLVDTIEEKAASAAKKVGPSVTIDTDLAVALRRHSPDVVFDCTTPDVRMEIISTAFRYGCHVLVEKPLANSLVEARRIVSLAKRENKMCATMQNFRYNNGVRRLSKFLKAGAMGEITYCSTNFFIGSRFNDFREHMKHVLLRDMAIHTFDTVRAVLDADPVSVYCKEWNPKGSWFDQDASAVAIFEFSNNLVYTYQGSWCSQGLRTAWASQWRINGTGGSITWDGANNFQVQAVDTKFKENPQLIALSIPEYDKMDEFDGHAGVISEFIKCIRTNQQPETICTDNIKSLQMVYAAIESSERSERVKVIN
jgi:predicted dehydrogenase